MTTADRLAKRRRLAHMRRQSDKSAVNTCPNCGAVTYNTGLCVPCDEVNQFALRHVPQLAGYQRAEDVADIEQAQAFCDSMEPAGRAVVAQFAPETAFNPNVRAI